MKSIVEGFAFCCDHGVDDGERERSHVHKGDGGPLPSKAIHRHHLLIESRKFFIFCVKNFILLSFLCGFNPIYDARSDFFAQVSKSFFSPHSTVPSRIRKEEIMNQKKFLCNPISHARRGSDLVFFIDFCWSMLNPFNQQTTSWLAGEIQSEWLLNFFNYQLSVVS